MKNNVAYNQSKNEAVDNQGQPDYYWNSYLTKYTINYCVITLNSVCDV